MNWTEMTCTKLTQLHDALLVTRVSVTKLIGCRAAVHALRFSSVQFSSSAVFPQLNWTDLKSRSHLRWRCYAARCCARDSNSVYFNGDIYAYAVAKRLLCFTSAAQGIGNESVPIQLAQCWFPRLAISNAEVQTVLFCKRIFSGTVIRWQSM